VARNTRIPKAELTGIYGATVKRSSKKMLGEVAEPAEAMRQTPSAVTDELSARLLKALGVPAMVELTAWIAYANQATRNSTALGIEFKGSSAACEIPLATPSRNIGSTS
jgi:hypothetical protein